MLFTRNIFEPTRWQYYFIKVNKLMKCLFPEQIKEASDCSCHTHGPWWGTVVRQCGKQEASGEDTDKSCSCCSNHAMWCGLCPFFLPAISIRKANSKKTNSVMCVASSMLSPGFSTSMSVSLAWWVPSMEAPLGHLSYRGGNMFHKGVYRLEWEISFKRLAISPQLLLIPIVFFVSISFI